MLVAATHIRVKPWKAIPFLRASLRAGKQARQAPGYIDGWLVKRGRDHWTLTLWQDAESMVAYKRVGAHGQVMRKTSNWAQAFASAHWHAEQAPALDWPDLHRALVEHPDVTALPGTDLNGLRPPPARPRLVISLKP